METSSLPDAPGSGPTSAGPPRRRLWIAAAVGIAACVLLYLGRDKATEWVMSGGGPAVEPDPRQAGRNLGQIRSQVERLNSTRRRDRWAAVGSATSQPQADRDTFEAHCEIVDFTSIGGERMARIRVIGSPPPFLEVGQEFELAADALGLDGSAGTTQPAYEDLVVDFRLDGFTPRPVGGGPMRSRGQEEGGHGDTATSTDGVISPRPRVFRLDP